jgi:hypothetical protein
VLLFANFHVESDGGECFDSVVVCFLIFANFHAESGCGETVLLCCGWGCSALKLWEQADSGRGDHLWSAKAQQTIDLGCYSSKVVTVSGGEQLVGSNDGGQVDSNQVEITD